MVKEFFERETSPNLTDLSLVSRSIIRVADSVNPSYIVARVKPEDSEDETRSKWPCVKDMYEIVTPDLIMSTCSSEHREDIARELAKQFHTTPHGIGMFCYGPSLMKRTTLDWHCFRTVMFIY